MRDPIEELRSFNPEGLPVNPMPASEVRRRGDRMRRRRNAGAAIAGVAAVTLLTAPLALLVDRQDDPIQPAPPAPSRTEPADGWATEIPSSFPLSSGLPENSATGPDAGVPPIELCAAIAWSPEDESVQDRADAGFEEPNSEGRSARTLVLYADDQSAAGAMEQLRTSVEECRTEPGNNGSFEHRVVERALDANASFFITSRVVEDGGTPNGELTLTEVARTGNAIFLAQSFSLAGGSQELIDEDINRTIGVTEPVLRAMCLFAADPCESIPEAPPAPEIDELVGLLPTEGDLEWNDALRPLTEGDLSDAGDPGPYDSCLRSSLEDMGATDTARRDFVFDDGQGGGESSPRMWAVVAQFRDGGSAYVAYDRAASQVLNCKEIATLPDGNRARTFRVSDPQPVALDGVEGEAKVLLSIRGPVPDEPEAGYFTEHGLAVVGNRLLLLVARSISQDYSWENGTPVERSLRNAAPRLAE